MEGVLMWDKHGCRTCVNQTLSAWENLPIFAGCFTQELDCCCWHAAHQHTHTHALVETNRTNRKPQPCIFYLLAGCHSHLPLAAADMLTGRNCLRKRQQCCFSNSGQRSCNRKNLVLIIKVFIGGWIFSFLTSAFTSCPLETSSFCCHVCAGSSTGSGHHDSLNEDPRSLAPFPGNNKGICNFL